MTEPPPRKRFQIHLSTAIVMMFVAGGIIWTNLQERVRPYIVKTHVIGRYIEHGFPFDVISHRIWRYSSTHDSVIRESKITSISYGMGTIDLVIALVVLFAVWFLCEWLIRRRAARK